MKYYKDKNGNVSAFNADGSQDAYIKPDMVAMTQAEVDLHIKPPLTAAQIIKQHNAPILAQMNDLDLKRIRPLAEGDTVYLNNINQQILAMRKTLQ